MHIRIGALFAAIALATIAGDDGEYYVLCTEDWRTRTPAHLPKVMHRAQFVGVCLHIRKVPAAIGGLSHASHAPDVDTRRRHAHLRRTAQQLAMGGRSLRTGQYLPLLARKQTTQGGTVSRPHHRGRPAYNAVEKKLPC